MGRYLRVKPPYSEKQVESLNNKHLEIRENCQLVLNAYYKTGKFKNKKATEYAHHGFGRRLSMLVRCIQNIYYHCPPEQKTRLDHAKLWDLSIILQSFILNVFACLDNLAWIWAAEKGIKINKNTEVGIYKPKIKKTFSKEMKEYLYHDQQITWYKNLENFRNALAHRIPLYIPPVTIHEGKTAEVRKLELKQFEAGDRNDMDEYKKIEKQIESMGEFIPIMTHSIGEKSKPIAFHPQVLADIGAIVEMSQMMLNELAREGKT